MSKRSVYIDFVKGITIFCVLLGHVLQYFCIGKADMMRGGLFLFIYGFHMPLFMLISGYLFGGSLKKYARGELIAKKTYNLLHTIIMGSIFHYLLTFAAVRMFNGDSMLPLTWSVWISDLANVWFLWSVLYCVVTVAIGCKTSEHIPIKIISTVIAAYVLLFLFPNTSNNIFMIPYFIAGVVFSNVKARCDEDPDGKISVTVKRLSYLKYLSLPAYPILMNFFDISDTVYFGGIFGNKLFDRNFFDLRPIIGNDNLTVYLKTDCFRWGVGLVGCIFMLTVCEILLKILMKTKFVRAVACLGTKTLEIYVLQRTLVEFFLPYYLNRLCGEYAFFDRFHSLISDSPILLSVIVAPLISLFFSFFIYYVCVFSEKCGLSTILFGKGITVKTNREKTFNAQDNIENVKKL
ncbi:MAG: acyltransferase family protein [Eubacteriales bacterium]|nr:acyltransferase family protein [Eubacteriales bacterium]